MDRRTLVFVICLVFTSFLAVFASDRVPVLVWSNDPAVLFPLHLAGRSLRQKDFEKQFIDGFLGQESKHNIVLFVQDKLSVSDFAYFADIYDENENEDHESFKHLKSMFNDRKMPATYIPSVRSPAELFLDPAKHELRPWKVHFLNDPDDIHHLPLHSMENSEPNLFIVSLPDSQHSHKSFKHYDKIIGTVCSKLGSLSKPYVAFYTGLESGQKDWPSESHHKGRELLQMSESGGVFINISDSFYMYASSVNITFNGSSDGSGGMIETFAVADSNTACNATGTLCVIVLTFTTSSSSNGTIQMEFNTTSGTSYGFWYMSNFLLTYQSGSSEVMVTYDPSFLQMTPFGMSYHCNNLPPLTVLNSSSPFDAPQIQFNDFQIQVFTIQNGRFGYYNDCVGFFTAGTWMFLLSAVVLISVLFYGIIMLLQLTTMDRFDDAKGKTITVAVGD